MKITVEHEIPNDKGLENMCYYAGDFEGNSVCPYHKFRDRMHGRKAPVERRKPKCDLFGCWLDRNYVKCEACVEATRRAVQE